jgi:putative peptide zinc metalloprotease protein
VLAAPLARWSRQAMDAAAPGRDLARVRLRLGLVLGGAAVLLCVVPVPLTTVAPAVVALPERAQVRPDVEGFVAELPVADGQRVEEGALLMRLSNPDLLTARDQLASQLEGKRVEQNLLLLRDTAAAANSELELKNLADELARAQERIAKLEVRAQTAGRLVMPRQKDLLGTFLAQGAVVGHVLEKGNLTVQAVVSDKDAFWVRHRTTQAQVRVADAPGQVWPAHIRSDTPAAVRQLPSLALTAQGGGPFATDPDDKSGLQAVEPVFLFDVAVDSGPLERVGSRAWVRFDHGSEPLALQLYRRALQVFLRHFASD